MTEDWIYRKGRFTEMNGGEVWGPTGKVLTINLEALCVGEAREISRAIVDALEAWAETSNPTKQVVTTPLIQTAVSYLKTVGDEDTFGQPLHKDSPVYRGPLRSAPGLHILSEPSFRHHGVSGRVYEEYFWDGHGFALKGEARWK